MEIGLNSRNNAGLFISYAFKYYFRLIIINLYIVLLSFNCGR